MSSTSTAAGIRQVSAEIARFMRGLKNVQNQVGHRERHGVDPSAYPVLFQLVESPKRTTELATCLHADTSTISRQVTSLVEIGLVERTADPEDRRATILVATAAGRAAYDAMTEARQRMLSRVLAQWSPADITDLVSLLTRFNDDFEVARPAITADLTADLTKEQ